MTNSKNLNTLLQIKDSIKLRSKLITDNIDYFTESIDSISEILCEALKKSNKVFFCGNGGSAAEAQPREGMPAISLTTDTSFITAWSNDFGFDGIFLRQLQTLALPGDVLFAYSTSGNSKNVCIAAEFAIKNNIKVISMTGDNKNMQLEKFSTFIFKSPSKATPKIQEMHTIIGHEVCQLVEKKLFGFE